MSEMDQGNFDWWEWRRGGIGSSDAPVVKGVSPYRTPLMVYEEKVSGGEQKPANWAQQQGIDKEPEARARYELLHGDDMPAKLFEHSEHRFLRASLDGWNAGLRRVLEIKVPGREDHEMAKAGKVPGKYLWQVVHQMMVADALDAHYLSYYKKDAVVVRVERNAQLEAELLRVEIPFWKDHVLARVPPALSDRDFKLIRGKSASVLSGSLRKYLRLKSKMETLDAELEAARKAALAEVSALGHPRIRCAGARLMQVTRKGNVDYSKIEALKGLDLEPYRKSPTTYWDIRPEKKD